MRTTRLLSVLSLLLVTVPGCGKRESAGTGDVPVPVIAEAATTQNIIDYVDTVGRVEPLVTSDVGSQIAGRIVLMTKEVGDMVSARTGDPARDEQSLLARLDTDAFVAEKERLEAATRLAEADLPVLKSEYDRQQTLLDQGSGTEQLRDQAKAAYDVALARVDAAKAARREAMVRIEQSSIYSPIDAVVVKKYANVGDVVSPMFSPQLYQLECIRDLKINAVLPERDVPSVRSKRQAEITLDALPRRTFTGEIHTVIPSGDPVSHSFTAEIRFRNHTNDGPLPSVAPPNLTPEDLLLKPGMFARIKIIKTKVEGATVVPRRCVVEEGDKAFVYAIGPDDRASKTPVKTGLVMGDLVEITSGLAPGGRVVGRGIENVTEGQHVRALGEGENIPDAARQPAVGSPGTD